MTPGAREVAMRPSPGVANQNEASARMREQRRKFQTRHPDLWRRLYPRVYEGIGAYYSPQDVATFLGEPIMRHEATPPDEPATLVVQFMMPIIHELVAHQMPTYFVKRDLLAALMATDYRDEIEWREMEMPHEAMLFMLPRNALVSPDGEEVGWLAVGRSRAGDYVDPLGMLPGGHLPFDRLVVATVMWSLRADGTLLPAWNTHVFNYKEPKLRLVDLPVIPVTGETGEPTTALLDEKFTAQLSSLGIKLVLYMLSDKADIERGQIVARAKAKKGKEAREFWSPNTLGANYKIQRERGGEHGEHASPRMHWRRGHWRHQPCGEGRASRKLIWIEPILVRGEAA